MKDKIVINNLCKDFNNTTVLRDINFKVVQNDSVAIVGASGSGKSVLLKCISGLLITTLGCINIDGVDVSKIHVADRPISVREKIGMLFQSNALFDSMTISENITFGVYNKVAKNGYISTEKRIELNRLAEEQLEVVGIAKQNLEKYPYELSGGMQKRVAIARLITTKPEIILLDEPTTGLDPVTAGNISRLLVAIKNRINATMVTITHDPICVSEVAKNIVLIENKTIGWQGTLNNLQTVDNQYLNSFKRIFN